MCQLPCVLAACLGVHGFLVQSNSRIRDATGNPVRLRSQYHDCRSISGNPIRMDYRPQAEHQTQSSALTCAFIDSSLYKLGTVQCQVRSLVGRNLAPVIFLDAPRPYFAQQLRLKLTLTMRHSMPIVTPRLVLRPPTLDDLDAIQAAKDDAWDDLQLWMAWAFDEQRPRQALEKSIRQSADFQSQAGIALAGFP